GAADLGEIADPLQEPVGHPGRAARTLGDLPLAAALDLDLEDARGTADDPRQVVGVVVLEAVADPEAVAKRGRQEPGTSGSADERERGQVQGHRAGAGALPEHYRQPPLLHGGIERLLNRPPEPVDLVD